MPTEPSTSKFSYFINSKRTIVVISLEGELRGEYRAQIMDCAAQIAALQTARYVILNFLNIKVVAKDSIDPLAALFSQCRANFNLFTCSIPQLSERVLTEHGLLRENENFPNLAAVLQSILASGAIVAGGSKK